MLKRNEQLISWLQGAIQHVQTFDEKGFEVPGGFLVDDRGAVWLEPAHFQAAQAGIHAKQREVSLPTFARRAPEVRS